MPDLPARPDLGQLRNQAKDLLDAAKSGDPDATRRIRAVSDRLILASAQLAVAREYGFASWPQLKLEVTRRDVLNSLDLGRLADMLAENPSLAVSPRPQRRPRPPRPRSRRGDPARGHSCMRYCKCRR
jgi:uncharacterized protein